MMEVPGSQQAAGSPIVWSEVFLALCCCSFLLTGHWIGAVVTVNGVLCHMSHAWMMRERHALRYWDIGCNAAFVIYANLFPCAQPIVGATTAIALVAFSANNSCMYHNATVHALGVQLPLLFSLFWWVHQTHTSP